MLKAIQAIDLNTTKFTDEKTEIKGRLDAAQKAVNDEQKEFNKLSNSHRTMRSTLKNQQSNFNKVRVMKFGTLISKKEDKYSTLTKLGTSILKLLGEAEGNADLFIKFDHLKMKMNIQEAETITKAEIEAQQVVISGL
jgi:peptidoglycan hydrolase CwlO-like protein